MELTPEVKKQLGEQKKNCPFCKIIAGEIPSKQVYEDDLIMVVLDINPAAAGHVLVMTKEHYPIMPYISPEEFKRMFGLIGKLASKIQEAMATNSSVVFIANGFAAGQQAPHFMVHIIPREKNDELFQFNLSNGEVDEGKVEETFNIISNNLPIMMENHFKKNPAEWHTPRKKGAMMRKFTKEQVIGIIEQNPQLKQIIEKQPSALLEQIKTNEQMQMLFKDIDVHEVIKHFNPDYEKAEEAEFEETGAGEDTRKEELEESGEDEVEETEEPEKAEKEDDILGALGGTYSEDDEDKKEETDEEEPEETDGEEEDSDEPNEDDREKEELVHPRNVLDDISKMF